MKLNFKDITKVPNLISIFRILLIPIFVVVFLWENGNINPGTAEDDSANGYVIAAALIVLSGITDMADGFIARKFNIITDLGKALDPFADKLTQAAVAVCLAFRYTEILGLLIGLCALIFVKEITMLILGLVFLKKGKDLGGAKWFGKLATIVFYVLVIILIGAPSISNTAAAVIVLVMGAFTLMSFVLYMREYYLLKKEQ